jgi:hypothetical protein
MRVATLVLHWDRPEVEMNKLMTVTLIAGGLMLMNSPEAVAHKQVRNVYQPPAYYHVDIRRTSHMPRWLRRNYSFRKWYQHSRLQRDRRLAWHQLYEIFSWERRWGKTYYRSDNYWVDYYRHRYDDRYRDPHRRHDDRRQRH